MADEKLVLVERFEELKTGMRVVLRFCSRCHRQEELVLLGKGRWPGTDLISCANGRTLNLADADIFRVAGGCDLPFPVIPKTAVARRKLYRFASDIDIDDQIASEENPYLSRSVIGTGGVDEVRVVAKERR